MTHEATRLAEEARILSKRLREQKVTHHQISEDHEPYRTAIKTHPVEAIKLEAANLLDALAALAQPAPTAEVALPAVSGETQRLILETARDLLLMEDTPSRSRKRHAGDALDAMLKGNLAEQLPAVSEEAPQGFWLAPNKLSREMIDEMGICGGTYQGWWEGARRAALRLARAQSAAKGDTP